MAPTEMFLALLIGHALCDFALQSDAMAKGKNFRIIPTNIPPGQTMQTVWPYWLTSHALIHAGAVWAITGIWQLAIFELVAHWAIDYAKCANITNIHADQALHVGCKAAWLVLMQT